MTQTIDEVMTPGPTIYSAETTVADAARFMRDADVGDVLVGEGNRVSGIVTDRDIVVRAVADDRSPDQVRLGEICSSDLVTVAPTDTVDDALRIMREHALRRLPVCDEQGNAVGIVSLGDLSYDNDADEALADISAAPPNA